MAGIFKRPNYAGQTVNGLRVTKSLYGSPIPVWYGRTRGATQLIYAANFQTHKSGKKGKGGQYYTAAVDLLLGYGPLQGIGAEWVNTQYFQGTLATETFVTGSGTSFSHTITGVPANYDLTMVIGVTASLPFSVTYNDYRGPGSQSFSGNSETPLPNQLYPAPNSGDWQYAGVPYAQYNSVVGDTNVTVVFPSTVSGITIKIYYMYGVRNINGYQPFGGQTYEKQLGNGAGVGPIVYQDFSGVGFPEISLGAVGTMPNLSYEVYGLYSYGPTGDANPADVVADIICSGTKLIVPTWAGGSFTVPVWQHGLNFTSLVAPNATGPYNPAYTRYGGILDDEPNLWSPAYSGGSNAGLNNYRAFCQAYGIYISNFLDSQSQASQLLDTIMQITMTAAVWDGAQLKLIPYCEVSNFGNGASYVAPTASGPILGFTDDDYIDKDKQGAAKPPLTVKRTRPQTDFNSLTINFTDRVNGKTDPIGNPSGGGSYNQNSVVVTDQADVVVQGPVPGSSRDYKWVHDINVATNVGVAAVRRNVLNRRIFNWSASARFSLLTPMDLVTLAEQTFPSSPFPVRITKIIDNDDNTIDFEAESYIYGASAIIPPSTVTPVAGSGSVTANQNSDPGSVNTPIIFEAVPAISLKPQIWICLSGPSVNYGGCNIWLSTDGGSTYNVVGRQYGKQTMGLVYSSNYPSHADPDATNTLNVDLTQSSGTLSSFTTTQRDAFLSLCYLNGGGNVVVNGVTLTIPYELVAYATANLSAANKYALVPTIRRGVQGTPVAAHNIGQPFSFLDDNLVFELDMQQAWIGTTLHFKFTAFNVFGLNEQPLSAATDYTFTPTGTVGWTWSAGGSPIGTQPYPTGGVNPSTPPQLANDVYCYAPGTYDTSQELLRIAPDRNVTFPVNLTASIATCDVAPTANVSVVLNKNGSLIGSVNVAAGATTGVFSFASPVTFNGTSDVLTIVAPASSDATFAGLAISLWATRSN